MSILSTREWATLIWGLLFLVYIMCHKEIRKSFWKVIVIFFDKKLRILWEIILLYVLAITMIFYRSSIWENIYIKDIIIWFLFSGLKGNMKVTVVGKLLVKIICGRNHTMYWLSIRLY